MSILNEIFITQIKNLYTILIYIYVKIKYISYVYNNKRHRMIHSDLFNNQHSYFNPFNDRIEEIPQESDATPPSEDASFHSSLFNDECPYFNTFSDSRIRESLPKTDATSQSLTIKKINKQEKTTSPRNTKILSQVTLKDKKEVAKANLKIKKKQFESEFKSNFKGMEKEFQKLLSEAKKNIGK